MSSTNSAALPSSTACSKLYDSPIRDASCAMPYEDDHIDILKKCCNESDIVSYYSNCGLYCLAQNQTVDDLHNCFFDEGAKWDRVFCRGENDATATGNGSPLASASATLISNSGNENEESNDGDEGEGDSEDGGEDKGKSSESGNAATCSKPNSRTSIIGIAIGVLLMSVTMFGTV
ncbi:hypothetical protein ACHAO9_010249 [Fusarium lateritium]